MGLITYLKKALQLMACLYFLFFSFAAAASFNIPAKDWYEVKAPHFHMIGNIAPDKLVDLAQELEDFRFFVAKLMGVNLSVYEADAPLKVFVVEKQSDYDKLVGFKGTWGVYVPGLMNNYAVMVNNPKVITHNQINTIIHAAKVRDPEKIAKQIFFHEYTHYLQLKSGNSRYPRWYTEGFAEFISTLEILDRETVAVGKISAMRFYQLKQQIGPLQLGFLPIKKLIDDKPLSNSNAYKFYPHSWALVHYLHQAPELHASLVKYLDKYGKGTGSVSAFKNSFDLGFKELEKGIKNSIKEGGDRYLKINLGEAPFYNLSYNKMDPVQFYTAVGEMLLYGLYPAGIDEAKGEAIEVYKRALKKQNADPDTYASLALAYLYKKRFEKTSEYIQTGFSLPGGEVSSKLHLAAGDLSFYVAIEERDQGNRWQDHIEQARESYKKSHALNKKNYHSVVSYGRTFLEFEDDIEKGLAMLDAATKLVPDHSGLNEELARYYIKFGREDQARKQLKKVIARGHIDESEDEMIKDIKKQLKKEAKKKRSKN